MWAGCRIFVTGLPPETIWTFLDEEKSFSALPGIYNSLVSKPVVFRIRYHSPPIG